MQLDPWLLEILACPACHAPLAPTTTARRAGLHLDHLRPGLPGARRHPGAAGRRGPRGRVSPLGALDEAALDDPDGLGRLRPGARCCARSPRPARRSARRCVRSRRRCGARRRRPAALGRRRRHGRLRHRRRRGRGGRRAAPARSRCSPTAGTGCRAGSARWTWSSPCPVRQHRGDAVGLRRGARRGARLLTVGAADSPLAARSAGGRGAAPGGRRAGPDAPGEPVGPRGAGALVLRRRRAWPTCPRGLLAAAADRLDEVAEQCGPAVGAWRTRPRCWRSSWPGRCPSSGEPATWPASPPQRSAAPARREREVPRGARRAARGPQPGRARSTAASVPLAGRDEDDLFGDPVDDGPAGPRMRLLLLRDAEEVARRSRLGADASRDVPSSTACRAASCAPGRPSAAPAGRLVAPLDFACVYLALAQGFDPHPIEPIVALKARRPPEESCERVGRHQGDPRRAGGQRRHRGHQVRRVPADRLVLDAGRVDPLAGRLRQPGAAAARRQAGPAAGDPRAPVRLRPRALRLRVHRLDRAVQRRRPVRALRGLPQAPGPAADRLLAVGAGRWSWSSRSGWRASRSARRSWSPTTSAATWRWVQFVRTAKAPELPVVLLEDLGALLGLVFALLGVGPDPDHRQRPLGRARHR